MSNNVRKIILRQGQSPGDVLTFTRPAFDLKRAYPDWLMDIRSPCPELFDSNPHTTPLNDNDPEVESYNITYDEINNSGWKGLHFADAFRIDVQEKLNSRPEMVEKWGLCEIPTTGLSPEIYLTDDEKSWLNQVHCTYYWSGPYWILNAGRKADNVLKQYHRWQAVVDILNDYFKGRVRIVQIGHQGSVGMNHVHPELTGVFNLVGQTDLRQLVRLAYWSDGTIGPISFQFVLAAAFEKPAVVCAGGKEGTRWHLYNQVQWVKKNGCLPCALSDGCWLGGQKPKCKNLVKPADMDETVPLCFEMTTPQELADRVIDYYVGGRLEVPEEEKWHQNAKSKFEEYYASGKLPDESERS